MYTYVCMYVCIYLSISIYTYNIYPFQLIHLCTYIYVLETCIVIHGHAPRNTHGNGGERETGTAQPKPLLPGTISTNGVYTKGTRAHTHRELIREWLWEPKGSSLNYI